MNRSRISFRVDPAIVLPGRVQKIPVEKGGFMIVMCFIGETTGHLKGLKNFQCH